MASRPYAGGVAPHVDDAFRRERVIPSEDDVDFVLASEVYVRSARIVPAGGSGVLSPAQDAAR